MSITAFKEWMQVSTMDEKETVVAAANTSLATLYQLSQGHRRASAEMAGRIAKGIELVGRKKRKSPLPVVLRGDLCETCAACSYYRKECK